MIFLIIASLWHKKMHSAIGFQDVKKNLKINFEINSSQNI